MSFLLGILKYAPASLQPWMRSTLVKALKLGPLPKHLAFIMDGNRRYARSVGEDVVQGHEYGFLALKKLLEFLLHLDVEIVTVYAFSIENFGRPQREVDVLMEMAKKRLVEMCQHGELLDKYSVRIRVLGRLDLLPEDVRKSCLKAQELTSKNTKDEISASIRKVTALSQDGSIDISEISPDLLNENLYTFPSPDPDILIRTGAVNRLSDYLLWQSNEETKLHFIPPSWPEITIVDILPIVLSWQAEEMSRRLIRSCTRPKPSVIYS